ncbi:fatty-acid amide hydrolase 2-A [Drosophila eugracilis]|uniref:fatty-acid amide hydrolase 2-A n=1 Tax=Drosophila eugracilis TaxID=29029 RepID=UPI001BDA7D13|nr:fatty-acid amide hydrolase 2-A [Drosophila eugracilis]
MEIFVRVILIFVKVFAWIIFPILDAFVYPRKSKRTLIPPIRNRLLTLSVQELRSRLKSRQLTSVELVRTYIEHIEVVNKHLNALVESRFTAALEEATETDDLIASCKTAEDVEKLFEERPLLGLPVTIKESCALEGMTFSVGSLARKNIKAKADGKAVKRLKLAGAIPLLVSATPEYCFSLETDTLLNGTCVNPYDFERTPGGSSGGEGALNGAGASLFGIGSDIGGSIRIPSLYCGIFGHKPSGGVVSVEGHFPNSTDPNIEHYLVEGPMTRFAGDLSELLQVMAGKENSTKLRLNEPVQLSQIRILYSLGFEGINGWMHVSVDKDIKDAICRATTHLKSLGLEVKKAKLPNLENSVEVSLSGIAGQDLMDYLLEDDHADSSKVRETLWEIVKSLRGHSSYTTNALVFELTRRTDAFMSKSKLKSYLEETSELIGEFKDLLGDNGVLICPTLNLPAPRQKWSLISLWGVDYTLLFNVLGLPVTHVPMGLNDRGLPIGLSVIGAPNQDRLCLRVAVELERAFGGWKPPVSHDLEN